MNFQDAMVALANGKKVRHYSYECNAYITMQDGIIYYTNPKGFYEPKDIIIYSHDWLIYEPTPEPTNGELLFRACDFQQQQSWKFVSDRDKNCYESAAVKFLNSLKKPI